MSTHALSKLFLLLSQLIVPLVALAGAPPGVQPDGTIVAGDYRLTLTPDAVVHMSDPDGLVYDLFFPMNYPGGQSNEARTAGLKNPKLVVDQEKKSVTLTGSVEPANGHSFDLVYSMKITPDGKIRISLKAGMDEPIDRYLWVRGDLHVSREAVEGGTIAAGDDRFLIGKGPPTHNQLLKQGPAETVVLNIGNPARQLVFTPVVQGDFSISDQNTVSYRPPFLAMTFTMKGNELAYDIGFPEASMAPKSADTYAGIDFWKSGKLHMPQYDLSKNLIQNPGFETGFTYWRRASLGQFPTDPKCDEYSEISAENPHSGKRALALRGEPGQTPAEVATFAIPVEKDQDYALSFYARGTRATQNLNVSAQGFFTPPFMIWKPIEITGPEWKRYSVTFRTTHPVLTLGFGASPSMEEGGWIFVDSVQLEKGAQATEFVTKPVTAWISTGFRGNLWEPGNDPHAAVHLSGPPGSIGKIRIQEVDFFGTETDRGVLDFELDGTGAAFLPLPWAAQLLPGPHVVRMDISTRDGFAGKDTARLTVMHFLNNEHRNKNIFSTHPSTVSGSWRREAGFLKHVGIGSVILFDPESHAYHRILEENGILHFSSIFDGGQGFKMKMGWDQKEGFDLTHGQLKQVEELCFQKAKAFPEVKYWKLNNEPETGRFIGNIPAMNKMLDVLLVAREGTLRGNPRAVLIGSDPANMYADSGIAFVNAQFEAMGDRKIYDIPAIHPYRERPESPDRDADTKRFLEMLGGHGYRGDVWFTEGIYHQNAIVPEWSLDTHKGCTSDHFRAGSLSYDMGWGEKMAAAYTARSWLVSLKYGDRVKLDVDWGFFTNSSLDVDLTPSAMAFASNILGNLLGNATFQSDLNPGDGARGYIFQNDEGLPIAVIWCCNLECDKGKSPCPELDLSALAKAWPGIEYSDFMGNSHLLGDTVRLSPFPIFLRGPQGQIRDFVEALVQSSLKP